MISQRRPNDLNELETTLVDRIAAAAGGPSRSEPGIDPDRLRGIFTAQVQSRVVDHVARWLRSRGHGYYTIGSAGHEGNAAIAAALRPTDPALLHYRSGGFYCARAQQVPGHDPVRDVLAGMLALTEEPIAGGRHKVFGHPDLAVIPQTSTISSQLPRALGVALAIGRSRRLGVPSPWPADALAVCSFGDASANHSTAQGAINATAYSAHAGLAVPLLLVCEDNGLGISVPTPTGWIEAAFSGRRGLRYVQVDGSDPAAVHAATSEAAADIRRTRRPVLLHVATVRFLGHAGTDVESGYRTASAVRQDRERDPILGTARALIESGAATADELIGEYFLTTERTRALALEMATHGTLRSRAQVMSPLAPRDAARVAEVAGRAANPDVRADVFGATVPEAEGPLTLAETINRSLSDILASTDHTLVFGEDVAVKGGVYGVTRGLQKRFGAARVFDTLLDEQSILGNALGAGVSGQIPIPEIQYLAYLHNAIDQLRGEAASLSFFSNGQYRNPLVVRVAGYAYQKGFGGHFHNDNAIASLRDIPGLVIASPAHPSDAAPMLRTCVAAAIADGTVSVFLEPIALYHERDLHEPGDGVWLSEYAAPDRWADEHVPVGSGRLVRDGDDVLIVTWANGLAMSLRAARELAQHGVSCRVFDLRWLAPMPIDEVLEHAGQVGRVLVVDETRASGGVGEGIVAGLVAGGFGGPIRRVAAADSFIPLGDAANLVLVGVDEIVDAASALAV